MSYEYSREREKLFTDDGQKLFIKIRDNANTLLGEAGAFMAEKAWKGITGDSWVMLAALDRMVELEEIEELTDSNAWAQHRVFCKYSKRPPQLQLNMKRNCDD